MMKTGEREEFSREAEEQDTAERSKTGDGETKQSKRGQYIDTEIINKTKERVYKTVEILNTERF